MQTTDTATFAALLAQAITEPGMIHEGYARFWNYSIGNQLLAYAQCAERGITPGPIATFPKWKELGRFVRRGEKAITLCQPVTVKRTVETTDAAGNPASEDLAFKRFIYRPRWFVLSQTSGADYEPAPLPGWDATRALETLQITRVPFDLLNGNAWGFARRGRQLAVSPLSPMPERTLIHEIGHIALGHVDDHDEQDGPELTRSDREVEAESVAYLVTTALNLPGAEYSRGYLQHWLSHGGRMTERTAQRVFSTADQILRAGRQESTDDADTRPDRVHDSRSEDTAC